MVLRAFAAVLLLVDVVLASQCPLTKKPACPLCIDGEKSRPPGFPLPPFRSLPLHIIPRLPISLMCW